MTKREHVLAALDPRPVDRPPILASGCGVPLDVPEAYLAAAVDAVKASAAR